MTPKLDIVYDVCFYALFQINLFGLIVHQHDEI